MSKLYITTTQNVPLFFTPASIGERMLGYIIDMIVKASYVISLYYLFRYLKLLDVFINMETWGQIALFLAIYSPVAFYSLVSESLMEGRTLGKMVVKTRVVKIDGYQASFTDYFTRWIFRLVDIDMGFVPGVLFMLFTGYTQRLGDLAAGTAVISEKSKYNLSHTILADINGDYEPYFSRTQMLQFNDNDMRIIKENALYAIQNRDAALMERLTTKIEEVIRIKHKFPTQEKFIRKVIENYNYYTGE
ncbi:putative membrane protein YckC [Proteiniphilum saccharofermentans]|uniref:Putative membrane protein YckC n=1 Tax=Proteiniphilum saccharofermentans TaxID=1642647 RepID=A0A1R3T8D8_9BACT|nr:RDD family protein [Proteiniphilum saccharofermentans]SCD21558.1 putative membrane protein YckC [Proteiniphilum saccharofermentans]